MITATDSSLLALIGLPVCRFGETRVPLCDSSVSVFVPPLKQLRPATCSHMGMDGEREGGGDREGGARVKKSFLPCTLQFRSCSVPTQIKTSPVAYVNMLPTVLRFNEP